MGATRRFRQNLRGPRLQSCRHLNRERSAAFFAKMLNSTLPYSPRLSAYLDAALLGRTDLSRAQPIKAYLEFRQSGQARQFHRPRLTAIHYRGRSSFISRSSVSFLLKMQDGSISQLSHCLGKSA